MVKNHQFRLFSCCKWCSHWLCLSIINFIINSFFLYRAGIFQIFAWLNTFAYIFPHPDRFSHWWNLRRPMEREEENGEENVCNIFLSVYVFIPPALVIEMMSESILDTMNCDLQWTMAHPQYAELNFPQTKDCPQPPSSVQVPFMWIFIMEQAKIQVWTPKYFGQKYNTRVSCGCSLRSYREVV